MTPTNPVSRRGFLKTSGLVVGGLTLGGSVLAACGSDSSPSTSAAGSGGGTKAGNAAKAGTIGVVVNGVGEYTRQTVSGVYEALKGTSYDVKVLSSNYDATTETANMENLLSLGVAGIVIVPTNIESAGSGAKKAMEQNVPVGVTVWPGKGSADQYFAGVAAIDSVAGGRLIGEYLRKALPNGGKIAVVQGVVGAGFSENIDKGLDEVIAGSDIKVVVREQGFFDRAKAVTVAETAFRAHPDLAAIVDYAAQMSDGICQWMKDNNIKPIVHVTSDSDDEMMEWFKTPYLTACRYYSAAETGRVATQAVLDKIDGKTPTFQNDIYQVLMTKDNLEAEVKKAPYYIDEFRKQASSF